MQATVEQKTDGFNWIVTLGMVVLAVGAVGWLFGRINLLPIANRQPAPHTLITKNMRFGQETLHATSGEAITLDLQNGDLFAHSFDIDALDLHIALPAGAQTTATFTVPTPGSYTITCNIPGHTEAGMTATLVVE